MKGAGERTLDMTEKTQKKEHTHSTENSLFEERKISEPG